MKISMHSLSRIGTVCMLLAPLVLSNRLVAQDYRLDWFSIDGGGGTSTGGVYSLSGTIGQPDAGTMSGGSYTLNGGFWSIIAAIQTPGAPYLTITHTTTNTVVVSWPNPSTGFVLEETGDLVLPNWTPVGIVPQVVGGRKQVTVPVSLGQRLYRLFQP